MFLTPNHQRGVALFVVVVFVLLSMLLALWSARSSFFNELVVGNDADYQRAHEAAQALLQDAERDIEMSRENPPKPLGGSVCGGDVCRVTHTYKLSSDNLLASLLGLTTETTGCSKGICVRRGNPKQDFWNDKTALAGFAKTGVGMRYGQVTGAAVTGKGNPILSDVTADNRGGWYWIEVFKSIVVQPGLITDEPNNFMMVRADKDKGDAIVYRITSLAYGRKPGTMVVLQQTHLEQRDNLDETEF